MKQEIYALKKNEIDGHSVFLAGPTPRNASVSSWRPEMVWALRENKYTGDILIPEKRGNYLDYEYESQTKWEVEHLNKASCILFWIPRNLPDMPAFTTNIEFGEWMHSKKILLAYPKDAEKMRYLQVRAEMHNIPTVHTIELAVKWVVNHQNDMLYVPNTYQCYDALNYAIHTLVKDYPELQEDESTGANMLDTLEYLKSQHLKKLSGQNGIANQWSF